MAERTATEPHWLAARRERAASDVETLELPSFKGMPGWEFTDISSSSTSTSFAPATAR